jgi:excisionase family DNA binding protein/putative nucleotidyltransferase with HDIG domain
MLKDLSDKREAYYTFFPGGDNMKKVPLAQKEILKTREAAELLKVTTQTIKNYIYSGKLKALKTPGGHHRIRRSDLKEIGFIEDLPGEEGRLGREELYQIYKELLGSYISTIKVILKALDSRDVIATGHSQRVADYSTRMADKLGLSASEKRNLELAALLHDVGKIGISEYILGKPGKLTDQELFMVKKHPEIGEHILEGVDFLKPTVATIRHHHERFDGKGYPDGLAGNNIPLPARIISAVETYDFLSSDLSYRKALPKQEVFDEMKKASGSQLDPDIVSAFLETVN